MTNVIFVRHGEAEGNILRIFHGQYNSNLTENGRLQAACTAEYLKDDPMDILYASDLTRTMETARPIAASHGLDIIPVENLREINGGKWENVPWDDLPTLYPESYDHWLNRPQLLVMPNGESMLGFQNRIVAEVDHIVRQNVGKRICIVTHGTAIKVMLCRYGGKDLSHLPGMPWHDNASVTRIAYNDQFQPKVITEGENDHLGNLSTLAKQTWWRKF